MHCFRSLLFFAWVVSFGTAQAQFINPLVIPDTLSGTNFNLNMAPGKVAFLPGDSTNTLGINQDILGPTLIFNKGDYIRLNVTNSISDTTTMHWHGMHVSPENDGGPHTMIFPGATWSPEFTVLDEATTFWYHPHLHSKTAAQVYSGAAGMIIVRDTHEAALNLPRTYGVDDFPLIIQDKTFDTGNQFIFAAMNDTVMVNGTLSPFVEVPAQMVRFRLLNGSNQRVYNLAIPPFLPAFQIGTDGGLLKSPLPITRMRLTPGERAEIVIDFSAQPIASKIPIPCNNTELGGGVSGGPMGPGGGPGNPLDARDFDFVEFRVVAQTANPVTNLPTNLNTITPWDEIDADVTRRIVFDTIAPAGFPYLINSTPFSMQVVNDTVLLNDIEIWEIYNETSVAHPFHIHDVQFYIIELNGGPPPPHLQGKKDVILSLPGDSIRFIAKFEDFADENIPYMYHCHNLFHEDAGMMGQFIVVENPNATPDPIQNAFLRRFDISPNPSRDRLQIQDREALFKGIVSIELRSVHGGLIQRVEVVRGVASQEIDLSGYAAGMYLLEVKSKKGESATLRLIRE